MQFHVCRVILIENEAKLHYCDLKPTSFKNLLTLHNAVFTMISKVEYQLIYFDSHFLYDILVVQ